MTRLACATAEDNLPKFLETLRHRLTKDPGWFSGEELGEIWVVPKRIEPIRRPKGLSMVGEVATAPARIHVRLHLAPATAFAIVEALVRRPALQLVLGPQLR